MKKKRKIYIYYLLLAALFTLIILPSGCSKKKEEKRAYYTTLSELKDKRIGSTTGSIQAIQVQDAMPDAEHFFFNNQADMLNALRSGKIDAYADSDAKIKNMMSDNPDLTYLDERISGPMNACAIFSKTKKGKALCDEYSAYIRKIRENGELERIQELWFGSGKNDQDIEKIDIKSLGGEKGTLRLAVDPSMIPFAYIKDGELAGVDVDVFVRFCKEKGYGIEVVQMDFAGILPAVSTGKCDLACGGIAYSEERAESLYFSEPSYEGSSAIAVLRPASSAPALSLSDLKKPGSKISLLSGAEFSSLAPDYFPDAEFAYYDSFTDCFSAVEKGKVNATLGFKTQFTVEKNDYSGITHLPDHIMVLDYGFATQKNENGEKLCKEMNDWFRQLQESGKLDELKEKWENGDGKDCMDTYSFDGRNGDIRIATGGTWMPNTFYAGNKLTGYFIELMNSFCQEYGYKPSFESMPYVSEISGLNAGEYDVIADAVGRTEERLESVNITETMLTSRVYAFVPAVGDKAESGDGLSGFITSLKKSFENNIIREDRWKMLLSGFKVTLELSALAGLFGTLLGAVVCFMRMSRQPLLVGIANAYIRIFRGVPIVVLLLVLNYIVFTSADFPAFWVCVIGFSLDFSAYTSEMFRNGIEAVPPGQSRAATALGFGKIHGFRKVVLPQALLHILPVYTGQFIALVKLTSVAGYISVMDLTRASDLIRSRTYEAFFPLILTAVIYFILSLILIHFLRKLEKMVQPGSRRIKDIENLMEARAAGKLHTCSKEARSGSKNKRKSGNVNESGSVITSGSTDRGSDIDRDKNVDGEDDKGEVFYHVEHLGKSFNNVTPLKDFNCEIRKGDIISVIGPSGTGKSTFLNLLNQLETADSGEILFKGESILAPEYDLSELRKKVGMVFQSFYLFAHLTIVENIMLAQEELLHRSKEEAFEYSMEMLERVGLPDKAMNYPFELSGGQQQRVAIARQVAMDPEMILFDEPTSALDPTTIGEVLTVIRNLARNGMTMVIVTHEMNFARDVSNRVFYLDEGIIYEEGSPKQIFTNPRKDKTRQFIHHLKVLSLKIEGEFFDYAGAVTRIETFGHQQALNHSVISRMTMILEELGVIILQEHYREKTNAEFVYEYQEENGKIHLKVTFAGTDYDPLAEGDMVSLALVRNVVSDLSCHYEGGRGVIEGSF